MTLEELDRKVIKLQEWKAGSKKRTPVSLARAVVNNKYSNKGILDMIMEWAGETKYTKALDKLLENKEASFLLKDVAIVAYISMSIHLMGKIRVSEFADPSNKSNYVMYMLDGNFLVGYTGKENFVYPMVIDKDGCITNKGQRSVSIAQNPYYTYLKKLTYQYDILVGAKI